MLINPAIRCIVNSCYLSVYSCGTCGFGGKGHQAVKCWHQVENILSLSAMTRVVKELKNLLSVWWSHSDASFLCLFFKLDLRFVIDDLSIGKDFIKIVIFTVNKNAKRMFEIISNNLLRYLWDWNKLLYRMWWPWSGTAQAAWQQLSGNNMAAWLKVGDSRIIKNGP